MHTGKWHMEQEPQYTDDLLATRHFTIPGLLKAYWRSEQRLYAYLYFSAILIMTIIMVSLDVVFSYWSNYFYDALQAYDKKAALRLLLVFGVLATLNIIFQVYRYYLSQKFALNWRRWLTNQFIERWLDHRSYYYMENFDKQTDNPDQRIQEDVGLFITNFIGLTMGLISAVTTFFAFIYILWQLSGVLTLSLGVLGPMHIHGYLVWVSVIYAIIGTYLTVKLGFPLVSLNFEQQRREANFRFAAIDLRSHAEHVALYDGEHHQKTILHRLFGSVLQNWLAIILRQKKLLWFTASYGQAGVLLPLLVAVPNYFGKVFKLGGLMQSLRAFTYVQDSLSFIINSYTAIAEWQATGQRLTTFLNHLNEVEERAIQRDHLQIHEHRANSIIAKNINITTPQDKPLLQQLSTTFEHGHHYLLQGPSGIGKSTFMRVLAGIWPYAAGELTFPEKKTIMFLPQKPYMPIGTLAEAILFPDHIKPESDQKLAEVLRDCHLAALIPRLHEHALWSEQLSPGEQQRIAFARVLLHRPDWVFLDESTSMLDIANEKYLYELLQEKLPHCSIVSVGHRPTLADYHDQVINMENYAAVIS